VLDRYGAREATQRAVAAGADVLIQPEDVRATIDAIVAGVTAGRYPAERVTGAARRILRAKQQMGVHTRAAFSPDDVRARVGAAAHRELADTVATRSITLVRDADRIVPLRRGARVLSVTVARRPDLTAGVHFDGALRAAGYTVRSAFVDADFGDSTDFGAVAALARAADVVLIGSYVATRWDAATINQSRAFTGFVGSLVRGDVPVLVGAFGNPYLLQQVADVDAYLIAWSGAPVAQRAAARALAGIAEISGRLPIAIPPVAALGAGVSRPAR
jgi:beta-N-acetylhexosaminidase